MRRHIFAILLTFASLPAAAVYRCDLDGAVSYADKPCTRGHATDITEQVRNSVESDDIDIAKKQLKQLHLKTAEIERKRAKQEQAEKKARRLAVREAAKREKACQPLALRKKWAAEDVVAADRKNVAAAEKKARRAAERHDLACPAVQPMQAL